MTNSSENQEYNKIEYKCNIHFQNYQTLITPQEQGCYHIEFINGAPDEITKDNFLQDLSEFERSETHEQTDRKLVIQRID